MLASLLQFPYVHFVLGGGVAGLVALLRSKLRNKPPTEAKRRLDAALCGIGALGICWISWRLFPDKFSFFDSIPYGIAIGFLGAGRIYELALRKIDPNATMSDDNEK